MQYQHCTSTVSVMAYPVISIDIKNIPSKIQLLLKSSCRWTVDWPFLRGFVAHHKGIKSHTHINVHAIVTVRQTNSYSSVDISPTITAVKTSRRCLSLLWMPIYCVVQFVLLEDKTFPRVRFSRVNAWQTGLGGTQLLVFPATAGITATTSATNSPAFKQ